MIIIDKKQSPIEINSKNFLSKMRKKYGSTYFIDMTPSEKKRMMDLNSRIDFGKISVDGRTFDKNN